MKKIMLPVLMILLSVTGQCYANKALSDSMKTEIRKVSAIMYSQGNVNYIDADALCDGLISPAKWYDIYYKDGTLSINDKNLPDALKEQYKAKLNKFLTQYKYGVFSTRSDGLTLSEVFDEKSMFRVRDLTPKHYVMKNTDLGENFAKDVTMVLINLLVPDHLLDTSADYKIVSSTEGLFVNGNKIDEQTIQRYILKLNEQGISDLPHIETYFQHGNSPSKQK